MVKLKFCKDDFKNFHKKLISYFLPGGKPCEWRLSNLVKLSFVSSFNTNYSKKIIFELGKLRYAIKEETYLAFILAK